ncbi:ubiquitin-like modifier-activating enzyme [Anaeramoeba flamelloides]|uniref:Ubiquitin-like modifier-activating enzyme n=1 Tax=Anaeramoeba flamelloides TaxID=1746091 RepID=A0AAV7Y7M3_9EUKA|nr:ubiquitin-like modifier-activating enzyme [Anaeramoeba flamelloides]
MTEKTSTTIDESLYSRQLLTFGAETMLKLSKSKVLILNANGLAVEIAKNLVLAGVKSLTVQSTTKATLFDQTTHFFVSEKDVGENLAIVSAQKLQELNPYVDVKSLTKEFKDLSEETKKQYSIIICVDTLIGESVKINKYCRNNNIKSIYTGSYGLFSWCFCDFGEEFYIQDPTGEELKEILVTHITRESPGVITCDKSHNLSTGDKIKFREVMGMEQLNDDNQAFIVKKVDLLRFSIPSTLEYSEYLGGGIITPQKQGKVMKFKSLEESILEPVFQLCDFAKMDSKQLHLAFRSIDKYRTEFGRYPNGWSIEDTNKVLEMAKKINEEAIETGSYIESKIDFDLIQKMSFTAKGKISPIASVMGGFVAQECVKAVTAKYTPLNQWLQFDCRELYPKKISNDLIEKRYKRCEKIKNKTRYEALEIALGRSVVDKLSTLRLFMIGAGAIGCELLKNFALLGIGRKDIPNKKKEKEQEQEQEKEKEKGQEEIQEEIVEKKEWDGKNGSGIIVTDMDLIEKSNLNRQFLFRSKHIQKSKSKKAKKAILKMNPEIRVQSRMDKIGTETENIYDNNFISSFDCLVNALDNIPTRLYMDNRSINCNIPLLDSGTLGTKGHTQVQIPYLTQTYGDYRDPPEESVPFCTLKSFPNLIEHCIEWSRDKFETLFTMKIKAIETLISQFDSIQGYLKVGKENNKINQFLGVKQANKILNNYPKHFETCIHFGRVIFEQWFVHKIQLLLFFFPHDHKDEEGFNFWNPPKKRPPKILEFDVNDDVHYSFVLNAALIFANIWGVSAPNEKDLNKQYMKKCLENLIVPEFVLSKKAKSKKIVTDEKETEKPVQQKENNITLEELKSLSEKLVLLIGENKEKEIKITAQEFEKDDDSNHHIDFIHACSLLRARNYGIKPVDRLKTKKIAGKIIPAVATTTSVVSGLITIELIKLATSSALRGKHPKKVLEKLLKKKSILSLDDFKCAFLNLALPIITFVNPGTVKTNKVNLNQMGVLTYSKWDKLEVWHPNLTINRFKQFWKKKIGLNVVSIIHRGVFCYDEMTNKNNSKEMLNKKIISLIKHRRNQKFIDLVVIFEDSKKKLVETPIIRFYLSVKKSNKKKKSKTKKK